MAANNSRKEDPSTTSYSYDVMSGRWAKISTLLGGTEAMREAGESMLPRHPRERDDAYEERLKKAILYNIFELTLDLLSGKPFTDPVNLRNMPQNIVEYADDIDLQGNNLTRFCYEVFRTGLAKSFTHVLVDAPEAPVGPVSLADERELGLRPYFVHIEPENVLAAYSIRYKGEEILTHVRVRETRTLRDGFDEVTEEFIRVMDLVNTPDPQTGEDQFSVQTVWYQYTNSSEKGKGGQKKWVPVKETSYPMSRIPLATFYTNRQAFMMGKPPLLDLADMNIEHYQSYSDQINILTVTRFPLLAASGINEYDTEAVVVGPRNMLIAEDPNARFYYVEHSGSAIQAGDKHLQRLEQMMAAYGSSLLQKRPDRETAAARAQAEESVTSPLQRMVHAFTDFLAVLFTFMQEFDDEDPEAIAQGEIVVRDDFNASDVDAVELQTLQVMVQEGIISRRNLIEVLKAKKVLPEDFDAENNFANILAEIELTRLISEAKSGGKDNGTSENTEDNPEDTEEDEEE